MDAALPDATVRAGVLSVVNNLLVPPDRHYILTVDSILVLFEGTMASASWHSDIPARKEKGS